MSSQTNNEIIGKPVTHVVKTMKVGRVNELLLPIPEFVSEKFKISTGMKFFVFTKQTDNGLIINFVKKNNGEI